MKTHYVICHWLSQPAKEDSASGNDSGPAFICNEYGAARPFESEQAALEYISAHLIIPGEPCIWSVALIAETCGRNGERSEP